MVASEIASPSLIEIAKATRAAAGKLAVLPTAARNSALEAVAKALETAQAEILAANEQDLKAAEADSIAPALYARLKLGESKLQAAIAGVRDVAKLADPVGVNQIHRQLDQGLVLKRVTCPLGVLGIIFEARPEALIQITSLAIKSGNGVILKGGREAINSCQVLTKVIQEALESTEVKPAAVQLLTTRAEIKQLLELDRYVDLIIPRGSNSFVQYVQDNTRIPVLGHADGICHLYIDQAADIDKAIKITVDAKTHYPAACNAIETLLVHQNIAQEFLPQIAAALAKQDVQLRGDTATAATIKVKPAQAHDWQTEYSDLILSIAIVDSADGAIAHINQYGSKHTDAIVTEDKAIAEEFQNRVDAAGVYHNCSDALCRRFSLWALGQKWASAPNKCPLVVQWA